MASTQSGPSSHEVQRPADQSVLRQLGRKYICQEDYSQNSRRNREALFGNSTRKDLLPSTKNYQTADVSVARIWDGSSEGSRSGSYKGGFTAYRPQQPSLANANGNSTLPAVDLAASKIPKHSKSSSKGFHASPLLGLTNRANNEASIPLTVDVARLLRGGDSHGKRNADLTNGKIMPIDRCLASMQVQNLPQNKLRTDTRVLQSVVGNKEGSLYNSQGKSIAQPSHHSSVVHGDDDPPMAVAFPKGEHFERKNKQHVLVDEKPSGSTYSEDLKSNDGTISYHESDDKENGQDTTYFSDAPQSSFMPRDFHKTHLSKPALEVVEAPDLLVESVNAEEHAHTMGSEDTIEHVASSVLVYDEVIEWVSYNGWRIVLVGVACVLLLLSSIPPTALRDYFQVQGKIQRTERISFDRMCSPISPIMYICMPDLGSLGDSPSSGSCQTLPEIVFGLQVCPALSDKTQIDNTHIGQSGPSFIATVGARFIVKAKQTARYFIGTLPVPWMMHL